MSQTIGVDAITEKEREAQLELAEEAIAMKDDAAQPDWSPEEERAVRRKIDFIVLPLLGLGFFALNMDRVNIGNALTSTITTDLGINTNQINVGTQLMNAGIILMEIPSNMILQKLGPQIWLSSQIISWSLVATFQLFIHNYGSYLSTRLLLGFFESGFIPGALYTLSTWYKREETSLRVSLFFLGNLLAAATVSLIGAGILSMSGRYGIAGWRWLFTIEGSMTIAFALIFAALFPKRPNQPTNLISGNKWSYLSEREKHIATARVLMDDPSKVHGQVTIGWSDMKITFSQPRIWLHVFICLTSNTPVNALQTYAPSIIKSLGFSAVAANALNSVPLFIAIFLVLALSKAADKKGYRGPFAVIGQTWTLIAYICLWQTGVSAGKWRRYAALVAAAASNSLVHILNIGWLSLNCKTPQQRSLAMAMVIMAANGGGLIGAQIFRTEDAPLYRRAFTIVVSLAVGCMALILSQLGWYIYSNWRIDKRNPTERREARLENGVVSKVWRWTC